MVVSDGLIQNIVLHLTLIFQTFRFFNVLLTLTKKINQSQINKLLFNIYQIKSPPMLFYFSFIVLNEVFCSETNPTVPKSIKGEETTTVRKIPNPRKQFNLKLDRKNGVFGQAIDSKLSIILKHDTGGLKQVDDKGTHLYVLKNTKNIPKSEVKEDVKRFLVHKILFWMICR